MPHGEAKPEKANGAAEVLDFPPAKKDSLMVKANSKLSETVTITKGHLALFALLPAFLMLVFYYGGSVIGWARQDQAKEESIKAVQKDMEETRKDMQELKDQITKYQSDLTEQKLRDAEKRGELRGYQLRDAEDETHGKK